MKAKRIIVFFIFLTLLPLSWGRETHVEDVKIGRELAINLAVKAVLKRGIVLDSYDVTAEKFDRVTDSGFLFSDNQIKELSNVLAGNAYWVVTVKVSESDSTAEKIWSINILINANTGSQIFFPER
ncbi:MAG: hypothetical protein HY254_11220 [Burkholderiales bacterium]|nr:hypothetical protein [Burkholderiales bacterium]